MWGTYCVCTRNPTQAEMSLRDPLIQNNDAPAPVINTRERQRANAERTFTARFDEIGAFATRLNQLVRLNLIFRFRNFSDGYFTCLLNKLFTLFSARKAQRMASTPVRLYKISIC